MNVIKFLCLMCLSTVAISCATFNISATDNNVTVDARKALKFESVIKNSKASIVLLATSPYEEPMTDLTQNAVCSGAIIDEIGHVITNYHCVHGQKSIYLYYHDKEIFDEFHVEVIGKDPLADLALLKVKGMKKKLPYLKFAKDVEKIKEGSEVFALGHPMGMAWTVTKGIVSSNERYARHPYVHAIQTDAAINKGNSGGPLMNMQGEIVGINALMVSRISENAGVGLAIRGDVVESSLKSMMETGTVSRPAIGIQIMPLGHPRQRKVVMEKHPKLDPEAIPNVSGMIISTDDDLPEGLFQYDTIIGINGTLFNDGVSFSNLLSKYRVGENVTLMVVRKRRYLLVEVTLREFPVDVDLLYPPRGPKPFDPEKKDPKN